jgi:hypothetical protein
MAQVSFFLSFCLPSFSLFVFLLPFFLSSFFLVVCFSSPFLYPFRNVPKIIREKWLKKFRHHKLKISFTSSSQVQKDYLKEHHPPFATEETKEVTAEKQETGSSEPKDAKDVKYEDTDSDKEEEKQEAAADGEHGDQKKLKESHQGAKDEQEVRA